MATVHVTLKGALADRLPDGRGRVTVPDGAAPAAVLDALGIPPGHCIYVVNGAPADRATRLGEGDRVQVHPPAAGG